MIKPEYEWQIHISFGEHYFILNSTQFELVMAVIAFFTFLPFTLWFSQDSLAQPQINDTSLNIEILTDGLSEPTSMAFLDEDSILVTEKDGSVRLVSNGVLNQEPVLNLEVRTESERGLLGIDVLGGTNVYLYFTQATSDGSVVNRIYKYDWDGNQLTNPTPLLDLPGEPGPNHDGGKLLIAPGPETALFAVIGDLNHDGKLQNFNAGPEPDDTSVIVRLNPEDGAALGDNPFSISGIAGNGETSDSMSKYFAYGVRNSFGLATDPVTGILWDTENGAGMFDEINIVRSGFNSGWQEVMGPIAQEGKTVDDLVMFPGSHYKDPLLSWASPPALTAIEFLNSSKLGDKYANNLFVGDYNGGNLYFFMLNEQRDDLILDGFGLGDALSDRVVDSSEELSAIIFGTGFGGITDIKTGPDGLLYILSFGDGRIYRLGPS